MSTIKILISILFLIFIVEAGVVYGSCATYQPLVDNSNFIQKAADVVQTKVSNAMGSAKEAWGALVELGREGKVYQDAAGNIIPNLGSYTSTVMGNNIQGQSVTSYVNTQTVSFTGDNAAQQMTYYLNNYNETMGTYTEAGDFFSSTISSAPPPWGGYQLPWFRREWPSWNLNPPERQAAEMAAGVPLYGICSNPEDCRNKSRELLQDWNLNNTIDALIGAPHQQIGTNKSEDSNTAIMQLKQNNFTDSQINYMQSTGAPPPTYAEALTAFYNDKTGKVQFPDQADFWSNARQYK